MFFFVVVNFFVWFDIDVVVNQFGEGGDKVCCCQWFQCFFLQIDIGIDLWFFWQFVIQFWLVGMMQDVYYVGFVDVWWVVNFGVGIIVFFKFSYLFFGYFQYFFFCIEVDCVGRIGFYVGWFLVDVDLIYVQGVFIDLVIFFIEVWDVKWIFCNVVVVVDVVFLLEIDDVVGVLNNCFGGWVGFQVVWFCVVYIVIFVDKLFQFVVLFGFVKMYYCSGFGVEICWVVVYFDVVFYVIVDVILFRIGYLVGFIVYVGGDIDKFGDFCFIVLCVWCGGDWVGCGVFNNVLGFYCY